MSRRASSILAPLLVLGIQVVTLRALPVDLRPEAQAARSLPSETELREWAAAKREAIASERWEEAKELTSRLLRFAPSDHGSLGDLARIERALGDDAAESEAWERYLRAAPVPLHACPDVAFSYRRQERFEDYLRACEICLSYDAKNADSLFCVGHANERLGRLDRAKDAYERALERAPEYADVSLGLARIAFRTGRIDEAARRAAEALANRPGDHDALEMLRRTGRKAPASSAAP